MERVALIQIAPWFVLAQAADLGTTLFNLSRGCYELNPVFQGGTMHLVVAKLCITTGVCVLAWVLETGGYARYARIMLWTGLITAGMAAGWNAVISPLCGTS